ncbi:hypothetical protein NLI96_g10090 [Meripilus lineatus]|uniref:Uncharacterized protein n=1 Tax=Meripilus lineatus TaxID=2056292 RepID=A0AAD5UW08_9APHY|nr:hypothetical protein NLI96_g10090 [Physisporinus lineatus]
MPVTLVLPEGIQYVPIVFAASTWVVFWQVGQVAKARAKAKILYPQLYAEKSEAAAAKDALVFNCVQRAHHNTMETLPLVLLSASIIATKYPIVAASLYGAWTLFRIPYTIGYRTAKLPESSHDELLAHCWFACDIDIHCREKLLGMKSLGSVALFHIVV